MIHEYLFEEYADFGRGHAHDLAPFDVYHKVRGLKWPVVDGKETQWRFNVKYDPYAAKAAKETGANDFAFYGTFAKALAQGDLKVSKIKRKNRLKIKRRSMRDHTWIHLKCQMQTMILWLCTGRVLEHWHSGQ